MTTNDVSGVLVAELLAALDAIEDAMQLCPRPAWDTSVWRVQERDPGVWPVATVSGDDADADADAEQLLQRYSAFWNVAYHALFFLDVDLSAAAMAAEPFAPPAPFVEADHDAHRVPDRVYSRGELQDYVDHLRRKAHDVLGGMTVSRLMASVPAYRHGPAPLLRILLGSLGHVREHAAQLHLHLGRGPA